MKPLVVLAIAFAASLGITALIDGNPDVRLSGRIALSAMLLLTCIGHFKFPKGMAMMIPDFIPAKVQFVYITGIFEFLAAIGLLIPSTERITGILLIIFFVLVLPANISAAIRRIDYEKGTIGGPGPEYLWFRIPFQLLLIFWVYWFAVR